MYYDVRLQLRYFSFKQYPSLPSDMLEDCISDTIAQMVENPPPHEVAANHKVLLVWAIEVLKGKIYHANLRAGRFTALDISHDVAVEPEFETSIDIEEIIGGALRSLTDKERSVVLMKNYGAFSYQRMAYICNVSTNAIKGLLISAKKKMQKAGNPPPPQ